MGKVVRGIAGAIITAAAFIVPGAQLLLPAGLSLLGSALVPTPKVSQAQVDRTHVDMVLDTPRKFVFGHTALATDLRYQEWWGAEQEYVSQVLYTAGHWVDGYEDVWLNDELAWTASGGTTSAFAGYFFVKPRPQATAANAYHDDWSNNWGPTTPNIGGADIHLQFRVLGLNDKAGGPFSASIPTRVTIKGRALRLYDPRQDSTRGGSGAMRYDDQSTWAFTTSGNEIGRNPALILLAYLIGWRIQHPTTGEWKLAVGRGVPIDRLDIDSFMTAANACDELVLKYDGTTYEPRYRADGMVSEADDPLQSVIPTLEAAMNGKLRDNGRQLWLQVFHNDLGVPVVDFTADDILGEVSWDANGDAAGKPNVVKGRYTDPSDNALFQMVDYPQVKVASRDGIDRIDNFDQAIIQSPDQAQRLANMRLQRKRIGRRFTAPFNAKAWAVKDGDPVRVTLPATKFDHKWFRVESSQVALSGVCRVTLTEEAAAIYAAYGGLQPAVAAATPGGYDPAKNPLIQAINSRSAYQVVTQTVAYPYLSNDSSISIAAFAATIDDGRSISLPAGALLSLASGESFGLFWRFSTSGYVASAYPSATEWASSDYIFLSWMTTSSSGTFPAGDTPPPGFGGTDPNCVVDSTLILMANVHRDGPGRSKPARDVAVGDWVWTQHEITGEWGAYRVIGSSFAVEPVFDCGRWPGATAGHRFDLNGWVKAARIGQPAGIARVWRGTVEDAHTYRSRLPRPRSRWVTSHNIKGRED